MIMTPLNLYRIIYGTLIHQQCYRRIVLVSYSRKSQQEFPPNDDYDLMEYNRMFGDDASNDACMIVLNHKRSDQTHHHDDAMIGFMVPYDCILFGNAYMPLLNIKQ